MVVLNDDVDVGGFAALPEAGLVDTLRTMTDVDLVGYGVQEQDYGGGQPYWTGLRVRLYAPSKLISGKSVFSDEFLMLSPNPGRDKGGSCFGDSGGPDLLGDMNIILGVNSYVTNRNCAGVGLGGCPQQYGPLGSNHHGGCPISKQHREQHGRHLSDPQI